MADGGTIFLDEIATLTPALQATAARTAERVSPLGSAQLQGRRAGDCGHNRICAAHMEAAFRRSVLPLALIPIAMPPLRARREDIPLLVDHFVRKHAARAGKPIDRVDPDVMSMLTKADWPGNVRELENTVERAVVLTSGTAIDRAAVRLLGVVTAHAGGLPSPNLRHNIEW